MRYGELAVVGTEDDDAREPQTPRERVLEAMIAVVECDDDDEDAYRAAWERFRSAAKAWLDDTKAGAPVTGSGTQLRRAFLALEALQRPMGSAELGEALGITQRSAQAMLEAMRRAGLPLRQVRLRADDAKTVRHALKMPGVQRAVRRLVIATSQLWLPSMQGPQGPGAR